jgi:hypothetical protein
VPQGSPKRTWAENEGRSPDDRIRSIPDNRVLASEVFSRINPLLL